MMNNAAPRFTLRSNHHIRTPFFQQLDGIAVESGNQVEFNIRPVLTERIHERHQPIKTGVAFQCDAQTARGLLRDNCAKPRSAA